jgi:Fe-S-cluster containining protein
MTDPRDQAGPAPRTGEAPNPAASSPIRAGDPPAPATDNAPLAPADGDCDLARAVAMCAADAGFLAGLERILRQADRAAGEHRFECRQCGECCRFERFGHRLYVTAGELALMIKLAPERAPEPIGRIRPWGIFDNPQSAIRNGSRAKPASLCPHQDRDRCRARAARALGCRLFFCDPAANAWFRDAYESFHRQIKLLHAAHGMPYVYAELAAALAELAAQTRPPD